MKTDKRGFTLTELIIVTVLGSLLIMAALQILITNQRTYTAQTAQIQGQQSTRAAMEVLFGELREISAQGGDIVAMSSGSLTVRAMRKFGPVCAVSTDDPPVLTVLKVGDWFEAGDSVFVFADNKTTTSGDDAWITAKISSVDTTKSCGTQDGVDLSFAGQSALFTADSVRTGAPVRSFTRYKYALMTLDGDTYLGRTDTDGTEVPLVGPLKSSNGVEFAYMDQDGNATTTEADVRQIEVTVRTASGVLNSLGEMVSDSATALIYTRN